MSSNEHNPSHPDPHPSGGSRFIGRQVSFDYGTPPRRLTGVVEQAVYLGTTLRGDIPDYQLTIRGQSGTTLSVSLVESYTQLTE